MKEKTFMKKYGMLLLILGVAAVTRLAGLGKIPEGILPDEAYGAYNAWALMTEGIDSRGYGFPVYFVAWGSGMSVLYSYLAIPLFYFFGPTLTVYRIPQAVIGILGVYAAYVLGREIQEEKFGLFFAFVLAINPWNIMNTRFGLDANMAPDMFLIAVTLLVLAIRKKPMYYVAAAIAMGLTLYCYALSWIVIPIFLLLFLLLYRKRIRIGKELIISIVVLGVMACPLLYFVGVNLNLLQEIKTRFFSIPKLLAFRGEEINIAHMIDSAKIVCKMLFRQYDGVAYTACGKTGAYYFFTAPFWMLGIVLQLTGIVRSRKLEKKPMEYVMLFWLVSAAVMCVLNEIVTVIHTNLIHIPIIFYGAYGIYKVCSYLKSKVFSGICMGMLLFSFGIFAVWYVKDSEEYASYFVGKEAEEAIEMARSVSENGEFTIVEPGTINFATILWEEKIPVTDYLNSVVYTGVPGWENPESFTGYRYVQTLDEAVEDGVYLIPIQYEEEMMHRNYQIITVNTDYSLAIR